MLPAGWAPVEELTAVAHTRDLEFAPRDQSIERRLKRGRTQLVPEHLEVLRIASVELRDAGPARRTVDRERLLLRGESVDAAVQDACELFPVVGWNVVEGRQATVTLGAGSD